MRKHYETKCHGNPLNKDAAKIEYILPVLFRGSGALEEAKSEEDLADLEVEAGELS